MTGPTRLSSDLDALLRRVALGDRDAFATVYDPTKGSALAWLTAMAHRRAIDRVRTEQAGNSREARYGAANADPASDIVADVAIAGDERRRVTECLEALTDSQRQCIDSGHRLPDVAAGGEGADLGGDDGHRSGGAFDDRDADKPRIVDGPGVYRRTRHRISTADRRDIGRVAAAVMPRSR